MPYVNWATPGSLTHIEVIAVDGQLTVFFIFCLNALSEFIIFMFYCVGHKEPSWKNPN